MPNRSSIQQASSSKERLIAILEQEDTDVVLTFVKSLSEADKKALATVIKQHIKLYTEYDNSHSKFGSHRGTINQFVIISIAAFVCLSGNDYKRNLITTSYLSSGFIKFHEYTQQELMKNIRIDDILEWYHPDWMSDFINSPRTNNNLKDFKYDEIVRWHRKGYIELTPQLIVATLAGHPYQYERGENKYSFCPENLFQYPETLSDHIWLFFEYPSDINYQLFWGLENKDAVWNKLICKLVADGHIDRMRALKECLLATNRNFIKPLTNWFADVFNELNPTSEELLLLQEELFQCFTSIQSKAVNNALIHIKTICTDPTFRAEDFVSSIPLLLGLSTKAIQNIAIDIADKLIGTNPNLAESACLALCEGFIITEESVQKKIARLIIKYGNPSTLAPTVATYADQILMSVKLMLKDYLEDAPTATPTEEPLPLPEPELPEQLPLINDTNLIPLIDNFEDFIFFLTQAFDNNEPWHSYYIPVYLQKFAPEITAENLDRLEPAFKQALKAINNWTVQIGLTDRTTAPFFISYGKHISRKYPKISANISTLVNTGNPLDMATWREALKDCMELYPFYYILQKTLDAIKTGTTFELLSTPTHKPLWIDPVVLVQRLKDYQDKAEVPYSLDLQLAIQRCALDRTTEALQLARQELKGELQELMLFLLDPAAEPPHKPEHTSWWVTAALTKQPHTVPAQLKGWGFDRIPSAYLNGEYKWEIIERSGTNVFRPSIPTYNIKSREGNAMYAEFSYAMYNSKHLWEGDLMRMICSVPYNHDVFTIRVLNSIGDFSTIGSLQKASLINCLESLLQLRLPLSATDYTLLALCLLAPDKTVKDYAASLWTEGVLTGFTDSAVLGKTMAAISYSGWLPIKRFTTLIETNMINISTTHNRVLERLISSLLSGLGERPIVNLKKLLEIYGELLLLNNTQADVDHIPQLKAWEKENSLKKIIKQLINA